MNWVEGNTKSFKSIELINKYEGIYYINMSPIKIFSNQDDDIRYINIRLKYVPSTFELKTLLVSLQKEYDSSDEVNSFYIQDIPYWLDKSTRVGLINSLSIQKENGESTGVIWLNHTKIKASIDKLISFLKSIEIYAIECFNVTQSHLQEIQNINDRESILNYDITKGYPTKLTFYF